MKSISENIQVVENSQVHDSNNFLMFCSMHLYSQIENFFSSSRKIEEENNNQITLHTYVQQVRMQRIFIYFRLLNRLSTIIHLWYVTIAIHYCFQNIFILRKVYKQKTMQNER